jgi:MFS superfamily sulfate permease-like transporter
MYEWVIDIRHKLLLSEYCVLLVTFMSIQVVGIDAGIILGVGIAIVDYVFTTARVSSMTRVVKQSRAVWRPDQRQLLNKHGYHIQHPKIVTLEIKGTVFFGSGLQLLSQITEEISINVSDDDMQEISYQSPRHVHSSSTPSPTSSLRKMKAERTEANSQQPLFNMARKKSRPRFVILGESVILCQPILSPFWRFIGSLTMYNDCIGAQTSPTCPTWTPPQLGGVSCSLLKCVLATTS